MPKSTTPRSTTPRATAPRKPRVVKAPAVPTLVAPVTVVPLDPGAVARRAYELFLERGGLHGYDVEDWLQAERELEGLLTSAA